MESQAKEKFLFIVSYPGRTIGGHWISAINLATALTRLGYEAGYLGAKPPFDFHDLNQATFPVHFAGYPRYPCLSRTRAILRVVRLGGYTALVCMDQPAIYHATPTAMLLRIPVIQVIPGGPLQNEPPFRLSGTVVFSRELQQGLVDCYGFSERELIVSSGRVDFSYFDQDEAVTVEDDLGFKPAGFRILIISRLVGEKLVAITHALRQVAVACQEIPLQVILIGGGEGSATVASIVQEALPRCGERLTVRMLGALRVRPVHLKQAELVIGQGRTVIEAIASGTPAAVCGVEGYKGLVRADNLALLAQSNLTGRGVQSYADLKGDLLAFADRRSTDFQQMRQMARALYDSSNGADAILAALEQNRLHLESGSSLRKQYLVACFAKQRYRFVRRIRKVLLLHR